MKTKRILAGALAAIMTFGLIGCGNVEKNSSNSKSTAAEPAETESSSVAESVEAPEESSMTVETESSSAAETEIVPEESSAVEEDSSQQDIQPDNSADVTSDDIAFFEQFSEKVYPSEYDTAVEFLKSVFGETDKVTELGEFRNALDKIYLSNQFDYPDGVSVLGEKFSYMSVDYDYDDKTIYAVGFHKNPDLNTAQDNDPSSSDCKESYDRLYAQFIEMYGEPSQIFMPEEYGFNGALWLGTPCGEIWLAWGDKIFGSQEADCIISFSRNGLNSNS